MTEWIVKYGDGKMVGNQDNEVPTIAEAKIFATQKEAERAAEDLNDGLSEDDPEYDKYHAVAEKLE